MITTKTKTIHASKAARRQELGVEGRGGEQMDRRAALNFGVQGDERAAAVVVVVVVVEDVGVLLLLLRLLTLR